MKPMARLPKAWPPLAIALVWLFLAANEVLYLRWDNLPLFFDPVPFFLDSINIIQAPQNSSLLRFDSYYPPFFPSLAAIFGLVSRYDVDTTIAATNIILLALLLFSTYKIGERLWGKPEGVLAATLLALYPAIFGSARTFLVDLALTAMVALSICFLVLSEGFSRKYYSLLFGLSLGMGFLTKHHYPSYVAGPLIFYAASSLFPASGSSEPRFSFRTMAKQRRRLVNLLDALLVGGSLASLWYLPRIDFWLKVRLPELTHSVAPFPDPIPFSPVYFVFYFFSIWQTTSMGFFILWLVPLPLFLRLKSAGKGLLLSWTVVSYAILTLGINKETRLFMPVLPALALMTASGLLGWARSVSAWKGMLARSLVLPILAFGLLQFLAVSYGLGWLPKGEYVSNTVLYDQPVQLFTQDLGLAQRVRPEDWELNRLLQPVREAAHRRPDSPLLVGFTGHALVYDNLRLQTALLNLQGGKITLRNTEAGRFYQYDFLIIQEKEPFAPYPEQEPGVRKVVEDFQSSNASSQAFQAVGTHLLDQGNFVEVPFTVYRAKEGG